MNLTLRPIRRILFMGQLSELTYETHSSISDEIFYQELFNHISYLLLRQLLYQLYFRIPS